MSCFARNVARAPVMGSVPFVSKMESITFWAIRCLTKANMTKAFNNFGERRRDHSVKHNASCKYFEQKEKQSAMLGFCLHICTVVAELSSPDPRSQM